MGVRSFMRNINRKLARICWKFHSSRSIIVLKVPMSVSTSSS